MNTTKQSVISRLLAALGRCYANQAEKKNSRARSLRMETLENRELLSATDLLDEVASIVTTTCENESESACYSVESDADESIDVSSVTNDADDELVGSVASDLDDVVGAFEDVDVPVAPSNISFGTYDLEAHTVQMYWVDNSDNEDGFLVQFAVDGEEGWHDSQKGKIGADITERTATGVYTNHTYDFRLCAYNKAGNSEYTYATYTPLTEVSTGDAVPAVGSQISASVSPEGATADYAWYVSEDGKNWSEEPIATTSDYTPTVADSNCFLKVVATGTDYNFGQVSTVVGPVLSNGPAAPSDVLLGEYDLENGSLPMSWTLNSDNETQIEVQYTTDGGKSWRDGAILKAGTESRNARIVRVGQTYQFRVRAVNENGASDWAYSESFAPQAEVASISVDCSKFEVGAKLTTSLTSTAVYSVGSVKATYAWYRSEDGVNWGESIWNGSSHTISADDVGCYLKVVATGKAPYYYGSVEYVTEVVPGVASVPSAPSDLTVGAYDVATGKVEMNWKLNSTNETSVLVEYTIDGGENWRTSATLAAGSTSRTANVVRVGQTYQFRVAASNAKGVSDWAYSENVVPQATVTSVVVDSGELSVGSKLTTKVESNAAFSVGSVKVDYAWYRSADGENWTAIGWTGSSYTISGDDSGCCLKVVVTGKGNYYVGTAEYTTDVVKGELKAPSAPSDVTLGAYNLETGELQMSWTLNSTNETAINVEYTIDGGSTWKTGAILKAGTTERMARIVRVGQTYKFRVNASNAAGTSDWAYSESFVPQAEVVGVEVAVSGLEVGDKLTAKAKSNAVFSVGSVKVNYAWYRSADKENWSEVLWTGSTYTLTSADANCYVKVVVTGKSPYYYGSAEYVSNKIEREKVAPDAPSDFTFGAYNASTGELEMSWKLNSTNETSINVQYTIDGGENWLVAADLGAGVTSRIGETVRVGNVYQYRVCASNQYGVSDWAYSDDYVPQGSIIAVETSYETPLVVGSVIEAEAYTDAQFIVGKIGVDYEWFRSVDGEAWTTTGATGAKYTVQTEDSGCYLKVVATGVAPSYAGSSSVTIDERVVGTLGGVAISGEAKSGSTLTAAVTPEEAVVTYEWYRSADGVNWEGIGATDASYTIQKADSNYYLMVVATGVEEAGFVGEVSDVTGPVVGVPAAPSDVILGEYDLATGNLPMSWTLNSTDEIAIGVEYSTDGGETWITSEKATTTLPPGTTSRIATNVRVGLQYRFRVCAKGEIGDSDWAYSETFAPTASLTAVKATYETLDVGSVVETSLTTDATYKHGNITAEYAWFRSADGENWEEIVGATGSSYTTTNDDLGCMLKVVATGSGPYSGVVETTTGVVSANSVLDEAINEFSDDDWFF